MEEESKPLSPKSPGPVYQTTCRLVATPRVPRGKLKFYSRCPSLKSPKGLSNNVTQRGAVRSRR